MTAVGTFPAAVGRLAIMVAMILDGLQSPDVFLMVRSNPNDFNEGRKAEVMSFINIPYQPQLGFN